jgi:mitochondrial transcription factor 1
MSGRVPGPFCSCSLGKIKPKLIHQWTRPKKYPGCVRLQVHQPPAPTIVTAFRCCMSARSGCARAATTAQQLSKWVASQPAKSEARRKGRVQIVSPSLCEDALDRLLSSLKPHHGCYLIDINPGTCLWSRHLHNTLQPRKHVLVESARDAFNEFTSAFIAESPHKIQCATSLQEALDNPVDMTSNELQKKNQNNPSILITVNLSGPQGINPQQRESWPHTFSREFFNSLRNLSSGIHRHGLVRVLAWVADSSKSLFVPRTTAHRVRHALQLEACSSSITEISGMGWSQAHAFQKRENIWPTLEQESSAAVRAAEADAGVQTPQSRLANPCTPLHWSVPADPELLSTLPHAKHIAHISELLELDAKFKAENPELHQRALATKMSAGWPEARDQPRWRKLLTQQASLFNHYINISTVLTKQRGLERRWREFVSLGTNVDVNELRRLEKEATDLASELSRFPTNTRALREVALDDYRAFDSSPRTLAWNRRKLEPLNVQADEFAPQVPLALVDITPSSSFREHLPNPSDCELFLYVVGEICKTNHHRDMASVLNRLLQGGVEEFVETCPSLKDPTKGGWHDLSQLRWRSLPTQLFFDITEAYKNWPFRPSIENLVMGSVPASPFEEREQGRL